MIAFPFTALALRVDQPIGTYYVTVLPAELVLQVATSDVMSAALNPDGIGYSLSGTQRPFQDKRLSQIADYIDRSDSAFPNSIILAANYNKDVGLDQDEIEAMEDEAGEAAGADAPAADERPSKTWTVTPREGGTYLLTIPTAEKLAAIIDGQHRLFAFTKADRRTRLDMDLICAVFVDLPKPFQAQLFATINSTQKPVDRSLTFELFGYNVSDEPEELWTPDKLAVFLTRKLGTEDGSPLRGRITVAPKRDSALLELAQAADWRVSTAVVVDGILRLISSNPKRDANKMRSPAIQTRAALRSGTRDKSPLRNAFIDKNDSLIYTMVENYLVACNDLFWGQAAPGSYIFKSVGVQALFDILRRLAADAVTARDLRTAYFAARLQPASEVDFSEAKFQVPAGKGRSIIRKTIEERLTVVGQAE